MAHQTTGTDGRPAALRPRGRRFRGATYFTSREAVDEVTVVVRRFPSRRGQAGADDPVYVLVHGIGVSARYFAPLAAELAKVGHVYVVDLPGHGSAPDPRRDVALDDHARVLAELLTVWGVENPVLVGHSMGSQVVALLAVEHPEITDRIVLMAPTMQPELRGFWRGLVALLHDGLRERPIVNWIVTTDYLLRCGLRYFFRQLPNLLDDRPEDRAPAIQAQTLVIRGDRDPIVSATWARTLTERMPRAELREVSGAHVVMFSDPVTVARHIEEHAR